MAVYSFSRRTTGQLRAMTSDISSCGSLHVGQPGGGTTDSERIGLGDSDQPLVARRPAHVHPQRVTQGVRTQQHRGIYNRFLLRNARLATGDTLPSGRDLQDVL